MATRYRARRGNLNRRVAGLPAELRRSSNGMLNALDVYFKAIAERAVDLEAVFRKLANELFTNVVARTPVDTGFLRSSWKIREIDQTDSRVEIRISNSAPYVLFIEFGSSQQAPRGMVRISFDEFRRRFEAAAKRVGS